MSSPPDSSFTSKHRVQVLSGPKNEKGIAWKKPTRYKRTTRQRVLKSILEGMEYVQ